MLCHIKWSFWSKVESKMNFGSKINMSNNRVIDLSQLKECGVTPSVKSISRHLPTQNCIIFLIALKRGSQNKTTEPTYKLNRRCAFWHSMARLLFIKVYIIISGRVTSLGSPCSWHCWLVIADSAENTAVLVLDGWMWSIEFTVSQSSIMSTSTAINWGRCCLCQTSKLNNCKHQKTKDLSLLRDLTQWDDICGLPTCISVTIDQWNDDSDISTTLRFHKAKYHKTCRSYCCSSRLERTRQKQDNNPDNSPKNSGHHWYLR